MNAGIICAILYDFFWCFYFFFLLFFLFFFIFFIFFIFFFYFFFIFFISNNICTKLSHGRYFMVAVIRTEGKHINRKKNPIKYNRIQQCDKDFICARVCVCVGGKYARFVMWKNVTINQRLMFIHDYFKRRGKNNSNKKFIYFQRN